MQITGHADVRMNQRGIRKAHIALAIEHGESDGDRIVLTAKGARQRAQKLREELKNLESIAAKGGITAVVAGEKVITTYRTTSFSLSSSKKIRH